MKPPEHETHLYRQYDARFGEGSENTERASRMIAEYRRQREAGLIKLFWALWLLLAAIIVLQAVFGGGK
jgi:hypothetical protein